MPPFQAKHSPGELIEIVRVDSLIVSPAAPARVSQSAWDEGRREAGRSDAPTARAITQRLGVTWPQLLRIAHGDPDDALRALGNAAADKGRKGLTLPLLAVALRQAAVRLGQEGLSRTDYRKARERIVAGARGTRSAGRVERMMPELTQIETVLGQNKMSWDDGLRMAGLELPERTDNSGLDERGALGAFIEDLGKLPRSAKHLLDWARDRKVSVKYPKRAKFEAAVAEITRQRKRDGLPALLVAERKEHRAVAATETSGPAARTPEWEKPEIIVGLARAIRILGPGKQLTQRALKAVAEAHPGQGIPSWSPVDRRRRTHHPDESWRDWVAEATAVANGPADLSTARSGPPPA